MHASKSGCVKVYFLHLEHTSNEDKQFLWIRLALRSHHHIPLWSD